MGVAQRREEFFCRKLQGLESFNPIAFQKVAGALRVPTTTVAVGTGISAGPPAQIRT